jgi:hypothetical protein
LQDRASFGAPSCKNSMQYGKAFILENKIALLVYFFGPVNPFHENIPIISQQDTIIFSAYIC